MKPLIRQRNIGDKSVVTRHESLETMTFYVETEPTEWLFTDNETNMRTCYGTPNTDHDYKKDSFHLYLVRHCFKHKTLLLKPGHCTAYGLR
jgi:hypothetical protein